MLRIFQIHGFRVRSQLIFQALSIKSRFYSHPTNPKLGEQKPEKKIMFMEDMKQEDDEIDPEEEDPDPQFDELEEDLRYDI